MIAGLCPDYTFSHWCLFLYSYIVLILPLFFLYSSLTLWSFPSNKRPEIINSFLLPSDKNRAVRHRGPAMFYADARTVIPHCTVHRWLMGAFQVSIGGLSLIRFWCLSYKRTLNHEPCLNGWQRDISPPMLWWGKGQSLSGQDFLWCLFASIK